MDHSLIYETAFFAMSKGRGVHVAFERTKNKYGMASAMSQSHLTGIIGTCFTCPYHNATEHPQP